MKEVMRALKNTILLVLGTIAAFCVLVAPLIVTQTWGWVGGIIYFIAVIFLLCLVNEWIEMEKEKL